MQFTTCRDNGNVEVIHKYWGKVVVTAYMSPNATACQNRLLCVGLRAVYRVYFWCVCMDNCLDFFGVRAGGRKHGNKD